MKALDRATGAGAQVHDLFALEETGFDEVPACLRRYYRHWRGYADLLGPNEILCPVCHVVLRSTRALRVGDELHCLPCLTSLQLVEQGGLLVAVAMVP
jgi:hypothetical protein